MISPVMVINDMVFRSSTVLNFFALSREEKSHLSSVFLAADTT